MNISLPRGVAKRAEKYFEKSIDPSFGVSNLHVVMPGEHSPDKACCATWIDRETYQKLKRYAKLKGTSVYHEVELFIYEKVKDVTLTKDDYIEIADATERARKGNVAKRRRKKTGKAS